ncbi:hypothetical protein F4821DRAFT_265488 [Hypoxylon rubiginosum]|uniref:Uncharacterized protein n=1 Tax=Hypoxylon rubiginosum TaxID=110542 RepID=A0ACC0CK79_9PEZI|nr:hypothetical protein F4821DRAFT_265488 [Hypoxylon rubiginosum]
MEDAPEHAPSVPVTATEQAPSEPVSATEKAPYVPVPTTEQAPSAIPSAQPNHGGIADPATEQRARNQANSQEEAQKDIEEREEAERQRKHERERRGSPAVILRGGTHTSGDQGSPGAGS